MNEMRDQAMSRTKLVLLAALVIAVAVAAVAVAITLGREDEHGTDAHLHIDPITTADEVAVAVMSGVHTWTPAQQQSPWDAMHAIADQLTGPMVQVQQKVLHTDGATTPLEQITVTVELELAGDHWRVSGYQYRSVGD